MRVALSLLLTLAAFVTASAQTHKLAILNAKAYRGQGNLWKVSFHGFHNQAQATVMNGVGLIDAVGLNMNHVNPDPLEQPNTTYHYYTDGLGVAQGMTATADLFTTKNQHTIVMTLPTQPQQVSWGNFAHTKKKIGNTYWFHWMFHAWAGWQTSGGTAQWDDLNVSTGVWNENWRIMDEGTIDRDTVQALSLSDIVGPADCRNGKLYRRVRIIYIDPQTGNPATLGPTELSLMLYPNQAQ